MKARGGGKQRRDNDELAESTNKDEDKSEEGGFRERVSDEIDELSMACHSCPQTLFGKWRWFRRSGFGPWSGPCFFGLWTTDRLSGPVRSKISPVQAVRSL